MSKILKEYIREILLEGIYDPGILKAVFMAGGPGSGKTFTMANVIQEVQSGYIIHDRLLRPSMVGVSKKPQKS